MQFTIWHTRIAESYRMFSPGDYGKRPINGVFEWEKGIEVYDSLGS